MKILQQSKQRALKNLVKLQPTILISVRFYQNNRLSNNFKNNIQMERKPWTKTEDLSLKSIVEQIGLTNWTLVAVKLSKACPGSERAGKQCRQRWINHLDMSISKKSWTKGEDKALFQLHSQHGNKWKEIAKHINTRRQNDIKNHFYATVRKGIRRLNKLLGFKKESLSIRKIKPSVLSKSCQFHQQSQLSQGNKNSFQGVFDLVLKLSRNQPSPQQSDQLLQNQNLMAHANKFLNELLEQNNIYQQFKLERKLAKKGRYLEKGSYKSEELNVQVDIDIAEYLCLGQDFDDIEEIRPRSQGASTKIFQMLSSYNGSLQQEVNMPEQQNI